MKSEALRPSTLMLPPAPYLAALIGGWWLDRNVLRLSWDWGAATQSLGWLLLGVGVALFAWTRMTFSRQHTTLNPYKAASSLCTGGPFRFSRNPIYVADGFVLGGATLLIGSAWPLLFAPAVWACLHYGVIRHEEAHLEARFGDAYRRYRDRVRRWL